jgi:hypothetical protein
MGARAISHRHKAERARRRRRIANTQQRLRHVASAGDLRRVALLATRRRANDDEAAVRNRLAVMHQALFFELQFGLGRIRQRRVEFTAFERIEQRRRRTRDEFDGNAGV